MALREEARRTNREPSVNETLFADHSLSTDEFEVRSLSPWRMAVIGNRVVGFSLHRRTRDRPYQLNAGTLDEATAEAVRAVVAAANQDDLFNHRHAPVAAQRPGKVYFIGGDVGAVKIGFAVNPETRIRSLQCGSPIPLRILAATPAMPKDERDYHRRFKEQRLHGEWFDRCPEIEAEIERLNAKPRGSSHDK